jgi:hypothetical protein
MIYRKGALGPIYSSLLNRNDSQIKLDLYQIKVNSQERINDKQPTFPLLLSIKVF